MWYDGLLGVGYPIEVRLIRSMQVHMVVSGLISLPREHCYHMAVIDGVHIIEFFFLEHAIAQGSHCKIYAHYVYVCTKSISENSLGV